MSEEYIHQYSDTVETIISLRKKDKEIQELKQAIQELANLASGSAPWLQRKKCVSIILDNPIIQCAMRG